MALSARAVVILLAVISIGFWGAVWYRSSIKPSAWAVSVLMWSLNVLIFSVVVWCKIAPPATLNIWSNIIRAHGLLALLSIAYDILTEEPPHV
jgi:hypothetical protein